MSTSPWNHRIQIASNHGGDQAIMNAVAAITVGYDARGGWLGTGNPPSHFLIHDFHSNDDGKIYAAAIMHALIVLGLFESLTLDEPPSSGTRTVTTDKLTYTIGDTLHFTGTGFTPNGNVTKCMTTVPPVGVCAGAVTADAQGNVSGDFGIGSNIPVGPQTFWLHDQTANVNVNSAQLTLLAQAQMKTLAIQAVVTGGFPVPDVTFHFIQDGVEVLASEVSIPNTQIVVGQQIKQSWNVPTGHTVQIVMRLANPLGAVDVPSTTVNT